MDIAWNTNLTQEDAEIIFSTFAHQQGRITNVGIMVYILATITIIGLMYLAYKIGLI